MNDLDRYISEITRVRRIVQIYIELFSSSETVEILTEFSPIIFSVFQRSLHDEILMSLSRLFDSNGYGTNQGVQEYLSQKNLVDNNKGILTDKLKKLKEETTELLEHIDIKSYRHLKIAHNDKVTMLGENSVIKHNIDSESIISLLEKSTELIIGINSEIQKSDTISIPVNFNEKYEGKGKDFISKIKKI